MQNINDEIESYTYTIQESETNYTVSNLKYGNQYKITIDEIQNEYYMYNAEENITIEKEETQVNLQYKNTAKCLFKNGNQCNSITGGWEIKPVTILENYTLVGNDYGWGYINKPTTCEYGISNNIFCTTNNKNESGATILMMTKNRINFEGHKKIHIKYSLNIKNVISSSASTCNLFTYYSNSVNVGDASKPNYRDGGRDFGFSLPQSLNGDIVVDIGTLKQYDEYLGFYFSTYEKGINITSDVQISEIWLEK